MITHGSSIKIFACNSNRKLAGGYRRSGGYPIGESGDRPFQRREIAVNIYETVRGSDVFVVQSTCAPVNDNLMELLIIIDAFKRASAGRITAVIPYFGYARQDRKAKARDPITAKLVADLITTAGADRVLTMDLHATQIQGFFTTPVDHLVGQPILVRHFKQRGFADDDDVVVVAPDLGSVTRARDFASRMDIPLAIIDKRRPKANVAEVMNIIGDVQGKTVIMLDDLIDTAGTITNGAKALVERGGAKEVYAASTHAVLSGPAIERIEASPIKELVITNTIPCRRKRPLIRSAFSMSPPYSRRPSTASMRICRSAHCLNRGKGCISSRDWAIRGTGSPEPGTI